ncbi:hypothetical protein EVAR_59102_1 [Eumeta japonica]|uniref:Uncharacterized protein n=1 Tax=Eumeta variegata TaxID=151549 RepID=A0A4C1Z1D8_EUMVA|nr:hypothetical protein EVAR_59102_1 [Eumeta japonica]
MFIRDQDSNSLSLTNAMLSTTKSVPFPWLSVENIVPYFADGRYINYQTLVVKITAGMQCRAPFAAGGAPLTVAFLSLVAPHAAPRSIPLFDVCDLPLVAIYKRAQTRWVSFNYGVPMATFQLHHQTLVTIPVLVKTIKRAQTRWVARLITEFLWPPSSSIKTWLPYSIKVLVKKNQTSPNSMGLCRLITEFLWPPSSSINRPCYHIVSKYSSRRIKEPKLDRVASFNYGVPMATFQLHHQTLVTI